MRRVYFEWWIWALPSAAILLLLVLGHDPFLRGADAYYYALQADSWASTGTIRIPDSSPVLRFMGILRWLGLAAETSVRAWIVGAWLLFQCCVAACVGRSPRSATRSMVMTWALLSPATLFVAIEFPKLFLAVVLVVVWFLAVAYKRLGIAMFLAVGSIAVHRALLPIAMVFVALVGWEWSRGKITRKHLISACVVLVGAITAYLILLPDRFVWLDLGRLQLLHGTIGLVSIFSRRSLPAIIKFELVGSIIVLVEILRGSWRRGAVPYPLLLLPLATILPALLPIGEASVFNAGERYAVLVPMFSLISAAFLQSVSAVPAEDAAVVKQRDVNLSFLIIPAALAVGILGPGYAHPVDLDPDYSTYQRIVTTLEKRQIPMLIAHHGLHLYYKFETGREAFEYEPEDHWDKTRIWRVLSQITPSEIVYYASADCSFGNELLQGLGESGYLLIREDCWVDIRERIKRAENEDLYRRAHQTWLNPSGKRPAFLYRKHMGREDEGEFPALPSQVLGQ